MKFNINYVSVGILLTSAVIVWYLDSKSQDDLRDLFIISILIQVSMAFLLVPGR